MHDIKNPQENSSFNLWATAFFLIFSKDLPKRTKAYINLHNIYIGDWSLIWRKAVIYVGLFIVIIIALAVSDAGQRVLNGPAKLDCSSTVVDLYGRSNASSEACKSANTPPESLEDSALWGYARHHDRGYVVPPWIEQEEKPENIWIDPDAPVQ